MQPPTTSTTQSAAETTSPPAGSTPVDYETQPPPPRLPRLSAKIVLACVAAFLLFAGSIALLYYTWLPRQNPNAMLVLIGSPDYRGVEVTVTPLGAGGGTMTDSFTPADNYRLRFHVPSGVYQVAIRRGDHTVWAGDVETHPGHPPFLRLPPLDGRSKGPTTRLLP